MNGDLIGQRWECVHFFTANDLVSFVSANPQLAEHRIDGAKFASKGEVMQQLSAAFSFPEYFGKNWDATEECLKDLEWLPAADRLLVVERSREAWAAAPDLAGRLIEIWLATAELWNARGHSFHLVFLL